MKYSFLLFYDFVHFRYKYIIYIVKYRLIKILEIRT